jgi:predicted RNA-binding Zn ribbon-like protein
MSLPTWVPGPEAKPAPMPLLLVQSFVNTWEAETGTDLLLDDEAAARAWLEEAGLLEKGSRNGIGLAELRAFRESIRALLVHNGGGPSPSDTELRPLVSASERCRLRFVLRSGGAVALSAGPDAGDPAAAVLAQLLLVVHDAQREGTWQRLKACRNDGCRWAYFDRSHAGRGAWCDMAVCGNRMKNRSLRARRSGAASRRS